jgi:hypothetical protein
MTCSGGCGRESGHATGRYSVTTVVPEDLVDLAKQMEGKIDPHFDSAMTTLKSERNLTAGMFTSVTFTLASAYAVVCEFMDEELQTKRQDLLDLTAKLRTVARNWVDAEQANTIRPR